MSEAARGTGEIAETVSAVANAAESTSAGARETQRAAHELAMMAIELQRLVGQFKYQHGPRAVMTADRDLSKASSRAAGAPKRRAA